MLSTGLSYVRHLKTVRTHLLWLVHHSKVSSEETGVDYSQGLTEQVWRNMYHKGQVSITTNCALLMIITALGEQGWGSGESTRLRRSVSIDHPGGNSAIPARDSQRKT